jgi:hypothetical protein
MGVGQSLAYGKKRASGSDWESNAACRDVCT